ncbi:MAG: GNAT family N-acetyltransferase [Bacteroidales bacterium]|nr:GNAT family N-acetyltransferase [Bacteroidales bacterium]
MLRRRAEQIWHEVFGDSEEFIEKYFDIFCAENSLHCVLSPDKEIQSVLLAVDYLYRYNESRVKAAYLTAIATLEQYRKKGLCTLLIKNTLNSLYKQGVVFCGLIAQDDGLCRYYGKLSFHCSKPKQERIFNYSCIDKNTTGGYTLQKCSDITSKECLELINAGISTVIHNKQTMQLYNHVPYARYLLTENSCIKGIAIGEEKQDRVELYDVFVSNSGLEKVFALLIASETEKDVCIAAKQRHMFRIVNAYKALELYAKQHSDGVFAFKVTDDVIQENNRVFYLTQGSVSFNSNTAKPGQIHITQLAKMLFPASYMPCMLDR